MFVVKGYELIFDTGKYRLIELSDSFTGLDAQMWQHEMEHINGKVFIDNLSQSEMEDEQIEVKLNIIDNIRREMDGD